MQFCLAQAPVETRKMGGFSLIELMVTLSILVVLTAIAVPSMSDLFKDARLSTQADLLVDTLNSARLEAVKRKLDMKVCPLAAPDTDTACSNSAADWSKGFGIYDGTLIIQRAQAKGNVTLAESANKTGVTFNSTFGSAVATGTFKLCATGRKEQQIDVGLSGHVSKKTNALCP